jgi:hypothetical protein
MERFIKRDFMRHFVIANRAILYVYVILLFSCCSKENSSQYNPSVMGELTVEFDNIAGSVDLELNAKGYINSSGENFTVTRLKYYVSNFSLINADGTVYTVPQDSCYFLIDESDPSTHEPLLHVPEGEYKSLSFIVGVDSLRSTLDFSQRTGVLDTTVNGGDMYFDFNKGYIFFNLEGSSATASTGGTYKYHIGGFGGYSSPTFNNIKKLTLDLTQRGTPKVKAGKETNIHLMVDVLKFFDGKTKLSIASNPTVMFDDFSVQVADNLPAMFEHDHTEN